jgi:hypothetical protein
MAVSNSTVQDRHAMRETVVHRPEPGGVSAEQ